MPKQTATEASDPITPAPVITEKPVKVAVVSALKAPKARYVRVENKLRQALTLSIVNDDGKAEELKLAPLATSAAIREDRLTDQIRRFADAGKVRIR